MHGLPGGEIHPRAGNLALDNKFDGQAAAIFALLPVSGSLKSPPGVDKTALASKLSALLVGVVLGTAAALRRSAASWKGSASSPRQVDGLRVVDRLGRRRCFLPQSTCHQGG